MTAADACAKRTRTSINRATIDCDVATGAIRVTAADACTITTRTGGDVTAVDCDVTT